MSEWIDVDEDLPRNTEEVLVVVFDCRRLLRVEYLEIASRIVLEDDSIVWFGRLDRQHPIEREKVTITHWRELPELPGRED